MYSLKYDNGLVITATQKYRNIPYGASICLNKTNFKDWFKLINLLIDVNHRAKTMIKIGIAPDDRDNWVNYHYINHLKTLPDTKHKLQLLAYRQQIKKSVRA